MLGKKREDEVLVREKVEEEKEWSAGKERGGGAHMFVPRYFDK